MWVKINNEELFYVAFPFENSYYCECVILPPSTSVCDQARVCQCYSKPSGVFFQVCSTSSGRSSTSARTLTSTSSTSRPRVRRDRSRRSNESVARAAATTLNASRTFSRFVRCHSVKLSEKIRTCMRCAAVVKF